MCHSGTCRRYGSEALLVEIEELASALQLDTNCKIEPTSCLGYCNQAPAVLVRKEEGGNDPADPLPHIVQESIETSKRSRILPESWQMQPAGYQIFLIRNGSPIR